MPSNLLEKDWGEIMHAPSELTEDEKHYHLAVELPGMDKENIKVEVGGKKFQVSRNNRISQKVNQWRQRQ